MLSGLPISSIVQSPDTTWTFNWTDIGAPSYRIVMYGVTMDNIQTPPYTWRYPGFEVYPPPVEIVPNDGVSLAISEIYKPYLTMQWYDYNDIGADFYSVQEYVTSVWVQQATVIDNGQTVFSIQTPVLLDGSYHLYGIAAVSGTLTSALRTYQITVVANPKWTGAVAASYSAGTLTISSH